MIWAAGLPVVDAVLMFFRVGADPNAVTEQLHETLCQSNIGTPAWTDADYQAILREQMK